MARVQRSVPESAHLSTAQGHGAKNHSQKRQPDYPGVGIYAAVYPFAAFGKAGARPHCPAKWNTKKPHYRPRESLYPVSYTHLDVYKRQGLPLAAIWLLGKVQSLKFAIQDRVYG